MWKNNDQCKCTCHTDGQIHIGEHSFGILTCTFIYINCSFVQNIYYVLLKKIKQSKTVLQQKCILRVYLAKKKHIGWNLGQKIPLLELEWECLIPVLGKKWYNRNPFLDKTWTKKSQYWGKNGTKETHSRIKLETKKSHCWN